MTITYTGEVANARLCAFLKLLFHWKGSIYKLMYKEILIFCSIYAILSVVYRAALDEQHKRVFENFSIYCESFTSLIPLSFVLGFYVSIVVTRWWNQYINIPWPDRVMLYVSTMIDGTDEEGRIIRRTIMRYLTLGCLIVFQATSVRIKKRFPTMEHLIEAGVLTKAECQMLDDISTPHGKWWVPFVWCSNLVKEARKQGRIADNYLMKTLIDEINTYRGSLGMLYSYDWISVPLVYTQVTSLAVYTYFLGCVFGRQFLDPAQHYPGHTVDIYIPFFTILQFFFYMGWLKVAEQLINPFGEDDDDFEMNWIIDRNMQVSILTADDLYGQVPPLEKDMYFDESPPENLPYTKSSIKRMSKPHIGSMADLRIPEDGMRILIQMETIPEDVVMGNPPFPESTASPKSTPIVIPQNTVHHHNLMNSLYTLTDRTNSRTSLQSFYRDPMSESANMETCVPFSNAASPFTSVRTASEKVNRCFRQSSQFELAAAYAPSRRCTFAGILSKQTSVCEDPDFATSVGNHSALRPRSSALISLESNIPDATTKFGTVAKDKTSPERPELRRKQSLTSQGGEQQGRFHVLNYGRRFGIGRTENDSSQGHSNYQNRQKQLFDSQWTTPYSIKRKNHILNRALSHEEGKTCQIDQDFEAVQDGERHSLFSCASISGQGESHDNIVWQNPEASRSPYAKILRNNCSTPVHPWSFKSVTDGPASASENRAVCPNDNRYGLEKVDGEQFQKTSPDHDNDFAVGRLSSGSGTSCVMPMAVFSSTEQVATVPSTNCSYDSDIHKLSASTGYESQESYQNTVTSITPLLKDS